MTGRYVEGRHGFAWEPANTGTTKGRSGKGTGTSKKGPYDPTAMFYYYLDGTQRNHLHVSLPIRDFVRLLQRGWQGRDNYQRRPTYRAQPSVTTQLRKGGSNGKSKGRQPATNHSTYPNMNTWNHQQQQQQHTHRDDAGRNNVWQRNMKRRTDEVPMDLDFMTAPVIDEHGYIDYEDDIYDFITSTLGGTNEEEQFYDAHEVEGGPEYEDDYYYEHEETTYHEEYEEDYECPVKNCAMRDGTRRRTTLDGTYERKRASS